VIASFSGVHHLRSYLHVHEHLGEPAIRKIARQVIKGVRLTVCVCSCMAGCRYGRCSPSALCAIVCITANTAHIMTGIVCAAMIVMKRQARFPVHNVTVLDARIAAGTGTVIILPSFMWRHHPFPVAGRVHACTDSLRAALPPLPPRSGHITGSTSAAQAGKPPHQHLPATSPEINLSSTHLDTSVEDPQDGMARHVYVRPLATNPGQAGRPQTDKCSSDTFFNKEQALHCLAAAHPTNRDTDMTAGQAGALSRPAATGEVLPQGPWRVAAEEEQIEVLVAWARIVLELYVRDDAASSWDLPRLRKELQNPAVHEEARALLQACLDVVCFLPALAPWMQRYDRIARTWIGMHLSGILDGIIQHPSMTPALPTMRLFIYWTTRASAHGRCMQEQAQMLPLPELLEHPWLNARLPLDKLFAMDPVSGQHASLDATYSALLPRTSHLPHCCSGCIFPPRHLVVRARQRLWACRGLVDSSHVVLLQLHCRQKREDMAVPKLRSRCSGAQVVLDAGAVGGTSASRRFSAVNSAEPGAASVMRAIFDTAVDEESARITAGTITGDEYQITATGHLVDGCSTISFTVKLVCLERGSNEDEQESYKVRYLARMTELLSFMCYSNPIVRIAPFWGDAYCLPTGSTLHDVAVLRWVPCPVVSKTLLTVTHCLQVLSFPYDAYHDTVDGVSNEMQQQFSLSSTDRELVASAMREVIGEQVSTACTDVSHAYYNASIWNELVMYSIAIPMATRMSPFKGVLTWCVQIQQHSHSSYPGD
jgi:hypothetical protein